MKIIKTLILASCFLAAGLFTACSGGETAAHDHDGHDHSEDTEHAHSEKGQEDTALPNYEDQTSDAFHQEFNAFLSSYLAMKDALVETDYDKAKTGAQAVKTSLAAISSKPSEEKGPADFWTKHQKDLSQHVDAFIAAADVEAQRKEFEFISNLSVDAAKVFGTGESKFYIQHCPMAFDNKGADWISGEDAVLNPYFGDVMLRCGHVKGEL